MATLQLRLAKGSPLTNVEMDGNLTNLNNAKLEKDGLDAMTGRLVLVATSSSNANVRLTPSQTDINPTTTVAGDLWNNQGTLRFKAGYLGSGTGIVNLVTTGDTGTVTNTMLAGSIATSKLIANGVTVTAGTGLSGGGTVTLGNSITLNNTGIVDIIQGTGIGVTGSTGKTITNTGVTSIAANTGISVNAATGAVTVTNTGVTSVAAGTGIGVTGSIGAVSISNTAPIFRTIAVTGQSNIVADAHDDTLTVAAGTGVTITTNATTDTLTIALPQAVGTSSNVQFANITSTGIGVGVSPVSDEIRAVGEITAYATSDRRLKENILPINDAIGKIKMLTGVEFDWKEDVLIQRGGVDGYFVRRHDIGVIAQEVEAVLPDLVATREDGFKAVKYEKLVAVLIEAVKDLQNQIEELKAR